jgi:hypothetical protein
VVTVQGCANDAHQVTDMLQRHFGFSGGDITLMLDTDPTTLRPTGANIRGALTKAAQHLAGGEGGLLYFHFSGHGSQVSHPVAGVGGDAEPWDIWGFRFGAYCGVRSPTREPTQFPGPAEHEGGLQLAVRLQ